MTVQNAKLPNAKIIPTKEGYKNFAFCLLRFASRFFSSRKKKTEGITLLLVTLLLSVVLSISAGIFNLAFGEIRISGEIADSFIALYAADQGLEQMLYRDRNLSEICQSIKGLNCFPPEEFSIQSTACYKIRVSKLNLDSDAVIETQIVVSGQFRCGPLPTRVVKRGFMVTY